MSLSVATDNRATVVQTAPAPTLTFDGDKSDPIDALRQPCSDTGFRMSYQQAVVYRQLLEAAIEVLHQKQTQLLRKDEQLAALRAELRTARGTR
jgi:hypothetical protein